MRFLFSVFFITLACNLSGQVGGKLYITPEMVVNESGTGDAFRLFDEQAVVGNPMYGKGGIPVKSWFTGFSTKDHPCYAYIDLGQMYTISGIALTNVNGIGDFCVYAGMPGLWEKIITDHCASYLYWNRYPLSCVTRYLRFEKTSPMANISEVVVYGIPQGDKSENTALPASVKDLEVIETGTSSVMLQWTVPVNEPEVQANIYLVRYSHQPINPQNFHTSSPHVVASKPGKDATQLCAAIPGLKQGAPYYFTIQSADQRQQISVCSNIVYTRTQDVPGKPVRRIYLEPHMLINEMGDDTTPLADEQFTVGDPDAGAGTGCRTICAFSTSDWMYPMYTVIDLGAEYHVSHLYLYDAQEDEQNIFRDPIEVFSGYPDSWNHLFTDKLKRSGEWVRHSVNNKTRYLRLKFNTHFSRIGEIMLYGYPVTLPEPLPVAVVRKAPLMDEFMGVNGSATSPVDKALCVGFMRENHKWSWNDGPEAYPKNDIKWDLSKEKGRNFDLFYAQCKERELMVFPVLHESVPYLLSDKRNIFNKPLKDGSDPVDPASYEAHGSFMFQYAARYGSKHVLPERIKLAAGQPQATGLELVKYYENWNEPNRWWDGREPYFTPYEYAAMASADYDGHEKRMGDHIGIKNADPDARLVMGGISGIRLDYIKAIGFWAKHNRWDKQAPFDVINVHAWARDNDVGISPEQAGFYEKMEQVTAYRNRFMPDKEVWVTEFGYDTHPESPQRAPRIGDYSPEEVQAQWIIRSYLAFAAAGVDKAALSTLSDIDSQSGTLLYSSGLIGPYKSGGIPKTSWHYVYTMKNILVGMHFAEEIPSNIPDLKIYRFESPERSVYAVWMGTSLAQPAKSYQLSIGKNNKYAKLIELEDQTSGKMSSLPITGNTVTIQVSERPVFVLASANDPGMKLNANISQKVKLTPQMVVDEQKATEALKLVDEQVKAGDPLYGEKGRPETVWEGKWRTESVLQPSAYIDLQQNRNLTYVFLFDAHGTDDVLVSTGSPGNWKPLFFIKTNKYMEWTSQKVDVNTRYIRFTRLGGGANFAEIVLYEK